MIHLNPSDVPAHLRGGYTGHKFRVKVTEALTVPTYADQWNGGSRETYAMVDLATGEARPMCGGTFRLKPNTAVRQHTFFQGRDLGLTFFVHPENAPPALPAAEALTDHERIVLTATRSFKASYNGKDRYALAAEDFRNRGRMPTRAQWDAARESLIGRKLLNARGAITNAGRNALES